MKNKQSVKGRWIFLSLSCLLFLVACQESDQKNAADQTKTAKVEKEAKMSINDLPLRDKKSLYPEDKTSVVTMYLTVRRGNKSENTDHSWSEINQYSAMDYEKMGVKRYQVAGLLQVGNEDGPQAGQLGWIACAPRDTGAGKTCRI